MTCVSLVKMDNGRGCERVIKMIMTNMIYGFFAGQLLPWSFVNTDDGQGNGRVFKMIIGLTRIN